MSQINVSHLSFRYDTSADPIFEDVSFTIDTDWKLGFIGRNGRGKTTFLNLLLGRYPYGGTIAASVQFELFPFPVECPEGTALEAARACVAPFEQWERRMEELLELQTEEAMQEYGELQEQYAAADGYTIDSLLEQELGRLGFAGEALQRPFATLSHGEQTRLLLGALFLKHNRFLLLDEPTNHLDAAGRELVADYLAGKKGFLLVSHDRDLLDRVVDHVLSLNRADIQVQKGNYSSWQENRDRQDGYERAQNERLKKEVARLESAGRQKAGWADRVEKTKYGSRNSGLRPDRGFIGHKSAKMMKRAKIIEARAEQAVEEKSALLKNLEKADDLQFQPVPHHSPLLAEARDLSLNYPGGAPLFRGLSFQVRQGDRVALVGGNGCGKSSLLKALLGEAPELCLQGSLRTASGLVVSYVPQDASFLRGSLRELAEREGLEESRFKSMLRKLDFTRAQLEKGMEELSEGQKKKVLLARSLCQQAHLYIWDEPLNFIDVLSRVQIERAILESRPTMLYVEHDKRFVENTATRAVRLDGIPTPEILEFSSGLE